MDTSITYTYNDPYEVIETHSIGRSNILYVDEVTASPNPLTPLSGRTREAGSKAREQERYYSIKPASSVLHDKGEVTERMRSNRGFKEANGIRIASISDTGEARYYLTDQVDSVKVVVDKDGITLNKFEYYPYGESWITEGEGNNNPKYNSQELDRETGFYFYNARHYDPEICRFVTAKWKKSE